MQDSVTVRLIPADELGVILPLVGILNPDIDTELLAQRLGEMVGQGFRCAGAYHQGRLVGVCGLWVTTRFYCGRQIEPDSMIVHPDSRSLGVGKALLGWVYGYARSLGCRVCELNSYVSNSRSHKFYFNEGFAVLGFHFRKDLDDTD